VTSDGASAGRLWTFIVGSWCGRVKRKLSPCVSVVVVVVVVVVAVILSFFACSAASARTLLPVISRITEWCTRRSMVAAVVIGSLKIRSHSLNTRLLVMITLRRS